MAYTFIPGVDSNYNFPPQVVEAMEKSVGWYKGIIPEGTNVKTFNKPGLWYVSASVLPTITNLPPVGVESVVGYVEIKSNGANAVTETFFYLHGTSPEIWYMNSVSLSVRGEWIRISPDYTISNLPSNTNLDTFFKYGRFAINAGPALDTVTGLPPEAVGKPGILDSIASKKEGAAWGAQIYYVHGVAAIWYRTTITISGLRSPWVNLLAQGGSSGPSAPNFNATPASHEMRVQAFKDAYPLVTTGQKGVVCFRYDHGLANIKSSIVGLHRASGIPFMVALNSRNIGKSNGDEGVTYEDLKAWASEGLAEYANHTSDHTDKNTAEGMYDTVVNGRLELEAGLGSTIHSFIVPGVSGHNKFEGFGSGSLNSYSDTLMGGLVLANHGLTSGTVGPIQRPLDGVVRQGTRHITWESMTFAEVKAYIDDAVAKKTAVTLMAHPIRLGDSGFFNSALVKQTVEYVKSLIDAGKLANISYNQSHHATL